MSCCDQSMCIMHVHALYDDKNASSCGNIVSGYIMHIYIYIDIYIFFAYIYAYNDKHASFGGVTGRWLLTEIITPACLFVCPGLTGRKTPTYLLTCLSGLCFCLSVSVFPNPPPIMGDHGRRNWAAFRWESRAIKDRLFPHPHSSYKPWVSLHTLPSSMS